MCKQFFISWNCSFARLSLQMLRESNISHLSCIITQNDSHGTPMPPRPRSLCAAARPVRHNLMSHARRWYIYKYIMQMFWVYVMQGFLSVSSGGDEQTLQESAQEFSITSICDRLIKSTVLSWSIQPLWIETSGPLPGCPESPLKSELKFCF